MLCGKARKSAANFFTLDDLRLLRDFPKGGSLRFYVRKKKKGLRPFRLIKSTCGWGLLLRGGAHRTNYVSSRDIRRRLLVNLRSRWSLVDMIYCRLRPLEQISRAASHKA